MIHLATLALLTLQDEPVAKWGTIDKDTRFALSWDFSLKYSDELNKGAVILVDSRKVEADLVADEAINGKGILRIEIKTVTWTRATAEFEITVTRDKDGALKDSVKITAPKESAARAEEKANEQVEELKKTMEKTYGFPVKSDPFGVLATRSEGRSWGASGAFSAGGVINGLFDWMMVHDDLGEDGIGAGDSWDAEPKLQDRVGGGSELEDPEAKTKMKATAAGSGVKVTGALSWTAENKESIVGPEKTIHSMKKDWSFADGYFKGGKRSITRSYQRESDNESLKRATSFKVKETLTIKKQ